MLSKKQISRHFRTDTTLAVLLTCALICTQLPGCARAGDTLPPASASETEAETQAAFEDWSRRFFREQLGDSFLNLHYTLTSPEEYGITEYTPDFGDFSLADMREERAVQKDYQKRLAQIDPDLLDEEQRLTYRILTETFRLEEAGEGLELYYEPLTPSSGIQAQLPILLAEFTFRERKDIEDYLTLLSSIDGYYEQILDFEKEKASAGLFMTDACADRIAEECAAYRQPADHHFLTASFDERIDAFDGLTEAERASYKARNLAMVEDHVIPAYTLLSDGLAQLKGSSANHQGLCYDPDGKAYYEYLVNSATGTTFDSIEALRDAISGQIDDDLAKMAEIINMHPEIEDQLPDYSFAYTEPDQILEHLQSQIDKDFPEIPPYSYVTKYVPADLAHTLSPAFFIVPPIDDYKSCIIYLNPNSTPDYPDLYPVLAHEGVPGHMYQNTYFMSHCGDDLRKVLSFTSYDEGWASYVENYSYTTDNGLSPALGSFLAHNNAATLGLHAITDINVNYYGWSREQVEEYLAPYFDVSDGSLTETIYNAMLDAPVDYLEYYVGYLEIIRMREQAAETLGNRFSLKEFHKFLLDTGPAPFTVIREDFREWLLSQTPH